MLSIAHFLQHKLNIIGMDSDAYFEGNVILVFANEQFESIVKSELL